MTRERSRSQVALTEERPPERMSGNILPLTAPSRGRRGPVAHWGGLEDLLAALPGVFAARSRAGREIANRRARSTVGDDAA